MRSFQKICVLLVVFGVFGCSKSLPSPPPKPPTPPTVLEGMCQHLRDLGCEEGLPVYNDDLPGPLDVPNQSCEDFHADLEKEGIKVNALCVSRVRSCDEIEDYRAKAPADCS